MLMAVVSSLAQSQMPIRVDRYDDANDYLPEMQRKNMQGIRLFLSQQEGESLFKVLTLRNVTVDVVARIPDCADFGVVFLLGGTSVLSIQNERLDRSFSFQPRSRDYWWEQKVATFLIDAPSDRLGKAGIEDGRWRAGPEHQADLKAVLDAVAQRFKGPLVVHGHSNGALSVANVAGLNHPAVKAYVYSSASHYQRPSDIVYEAVHSAPVVFVQHKQDNCKVSKTEVFDQMVERVKAPIKKVLLVDGGIAAMGGPCSGFAPHSFVGMEKDVVQQQMEIIRLVLSP
jgi:hypothetical protein